MKTKLIGDSRVPDRCVTVSADDQVAKLEAISNDLKLDLEGLNTLIMWIRAKAPSGDLSPVFVRELIHAVKTSLSSHVIALSETAEWAESNA